MIIESAGANCKSNLEIYINNGLNVYQTMIYKPNTWITKKYLSITRFFSDAIITGIKYGFYFYLVLNLIRIYFNMIGEIGQNEVVTVAFLGFVILIVLQRYTKWLDEKWFFRGIFFLILYMILIIIKAYLNLFGETSPNDVMVMAFVGTLSLIAMQFVSSKIEWLAGIIEWLAEPKWLNRCVFYSIFFIVIDKISMFVISKFKILQVVPTDQSNFFGTLVSSEASVLALIVTLSLVAVQLAASSYSARVIEVFRRTPDIWILLIIYIFAIFYGLIMLNL